MTDRTPMQRALDRDTEIEEPARENERLREALRPFADKATAWEGRHQPKSRDSTQITHRLGDFRAARNILEGSYD